MAASSWFTSVDIYCERTGPEFWSEPVNAVTNLAFLIAAGAAFVHWRAHGARDVPALLLIGVCTLIGIGSFLFHTYATRWAALADTLPIAVFIYGYLLLALVRFLRLPLWFSAITLVAFVALSHSLPVLLPGVLRGGLASYLPALLAMLVIGGLARREPSGRALLLAAGVFAVSLTFRTLDVPLCGALPLGTHFLWHILNGTLLYILLRAAIRAAPASRGPAA